jgi:hypothetical protein
MANDKPTRVARAKALLENPKVHAKGCSELVSDALGIPFTQAADILGPKPVKVGRNGVYNVKAGDIIGWLKNPDVPAQSADHVAVYIGEQDTGGAKIIDVKGPGNPPRKLGSYGDIDVFVSGKF